MLSDRHTRTLNGVEKMPTRAKAADRIKHADERTDIWVKYPYWNIEVEEDFQSRNAPGDVPDPWALLLGLCSEGFFIRFSRFEESHCVTLTDPRRQEQGKPFLLSGWGSDQCQALLVVDYKHRVMLDCDWDSYQSEKQSVPRR